MEYLKKVGKLKKIYQLFEEMGIDNTFECHEGCATCCTVNVTLTTLEYAIIAEYHGFAEIIENSGFQKKLADGLTKKRYLPEITVNQFAGFCLEKKNPPDVENDPQWGTCPFLEKSCCSIYSVRPFACRCMASKVKCDVGGYAEIDDYTLSMNNVFMQYIEHLDTPGFTTNLLDMIGYVSNERKNKICKEDTILAPKKVLLPNMKIPLILLPPEYQERGAAILKSLNSLLADPG
jgi:Fe-S-cluster containining protein